MPGADGKTVMEAEVNVPLDSRLPGVDVKWVPYP